MNRREVIAGTTLLLALATTGRAVVFAPIRQRRLIAESRLAEPGEVQPDVLLAPGEHLATSLIDALPADRYAARLSPGNEVLLQELLRDERVAVTRAGTRLLFDLGARTRPRLSGYGQPPACPT